LASEAKRIDKQLVKVYLGRKRLKQSNVHYKIILKKKNITKRN